MRSVTGTVPPLRISHNLMGVKSKKIKLPFLVWLIIITTLVSCFAGGVTLGFSLKGYAWFIPFVLSLPFIFKYWRRVSFPFKMWAPWLVYVGIYLFLSSYENAIQRTVMLVCPVFVGMAASALTITDSSLDRFFSLMRITAVSLFGISMINMGILATGALPEISGLAAESMTAVLVACVFASAYAHGKRAGFAFWSMMAVIPVFALTRTAMAAMMSTLLTTIAPLKLRTRLFFAALLVIGALGLFYTERVQHKMFYSGRGTLEDVSFDNPDFRTSGRKLMWEALWYRVEQNPWFGHGANSQEEYIRSKFGRIAHPHNDWLRLLHDYGYVGTSLYAITLLLMVIHLWRARRKSAGHTRQLFEIAISGFIPFLIFMVTDNIILYAAFFGNMHFLFMGLAYAAKWTQEHRTGRYWMGRSIPCSYPGSHPYR